MKKLLLLPLLATIALCTSCNSTTYPRDSSSFTAYGITKNEPPITQSLFNDKAATISEENIQKILDGSYALPQKLRVAIVKLKSTQQSYGYYWSDEQYLKMQQSYLDMFTEKLKASSRVVNVSVVPDLLISSNPSFTSIRESAVRMQADVVVVYFITSNIYSNFKLFAKDDIKAFATTQLAIMDVRTGLIPFSTVVTKDFLSQKTAEDISIEEARNRIKNQAILLTIEEIAQQLSSFLGN